MATPVPSFRQHFRSLNDPRRRGSCAHRLLDILAIAVCAVIANCDSWEEIAEFGQQRQAWFRRFLSLPNGIPSHDTFRRVFDRLDPDAFARCLHGWLLALRGYLGPEHIALDGKALRGSDRPGAGLAALQVVTAWATRQRLVLAQVAVAEGSNEVAALPPLLELLDLHGALVTADAAGCQKEVAQQVVAGGGDYLLTVKGNQPGLLDGVRAALVEADERGLERVAHDRHTQEEAGHGRGERREVLVVYEVAGLPQRADWPKVKAFGWVHRTRMIRGKVSEETCYFISSRKRSARYYAAALRNHWGIENGQHWQLDISFREDASPGCGRHAALNLAALRRAALGLLKGDGSKGSIARKRKRAALSTQFLEDVLRGIKD